MTDVLFTIIWMVSLVLIVWMSYMIGRHKTQIIVWKTMQEIGDDVEAEMDKAFKQQEEASDILKSSEAGDAVTPEQKRVVSEAFADVSKISGKFEMMTHVSDELTKALK